MNQKYLIHWGLTKGQKAKEHKYIARTEEGVENGKKIYRYFYDQASLLAYKAKKKANDLSNDTNKALTTAKSNISTAANNAQTSANKASLSAF